MIQSEGKGSIMDDQAQKGATMERRKTMSLNWDGIGEVDDDTFFETCDRMSSAVPLDLDDDDFDDCRMSFTSTTSSSPIEDFHGDGGCSMRASASSMFGDYGIWMAEPGSINERRRRLFQGMGLTSNKRLLSITSTKFMHAPSVKIGNFHAPSKKIGNFHAPSKKISGDHHQGTSTSEKPPAKEPEPEPEHEPEPSTSTPIVLVRSRSDGDIDPFSANTRRRKEELIGTISKQRLTRTSSMILAPQASIFQYADIVRVSAQGARNRYSTPNGGGSTLPNGQFGAFFLIKNLDTGNEFIVKESDDDGMWNRLSEVQTGRQLTLDEFEKRVGHSPVVKELMCREHSSNADDGRKVGVNSYLTKSLRYSKRRGVALLKNIKSIIEPKVDKEREQVDQQANKNSSPSSKWIRVRQQGKSIKEFTALHLCQEIQAHEGSIWTIRFSPDAHYLASAGEDRVIHVWEVQECEVMSTRPLDDSSCANSTPLHPMTGNLSEGNPLPELSPDRRKERPPLPVPELSPMLQERRKWGKASNKKKGNPIPDYVQVPETVFSLSEKPVCTFTGHADDVLDLSWSKSQLLLSASMDKTVRLWDMDSRSCLKLFAHSDYVTCIHFNPTDDDYFISGSLDEKVRIWSIPDRQLQDYTDLHEMVTAVSYTPDGQGAVVGSHKGNYRLYSTADCRLEEKERIDIRTKKKSPPKKITGFEFAPGNPSEVLVTSADSRIRIINGSEIIHKFTGFRNTTSQISASFSADGKYVVSASEDSQVYIWKHEELRNAGAGKSKGLITSHSHEQFQCREVSVAIPWPASIKNDPPIVDINSKRHSKRSVPHSSSSSAGGSPTREDNLVGANSKRGQLPPLPNKNGDLDDHDPAQVSRTDSEIGIGESFSSCSSSIRYNDSPSISAASGSSPSHSWSSSWSLFDSNTNGNNHTVQATAWGLVIVTAGLGGEIRAYQNFGLPVKVGR